MSRRTATTITITALGICLPLASTCPAGDLDTQVGLAVEFTGGDNDSAKLREYWYNMAGPLGVTPSVRLDYAPETTPFYARFGLNPRIGSDSDAWDGGVSLETGASGIWSLEGDFTRIGHYFAHDARTLYSGEGTGTLTIPDSIQANMQASTSASNAATRLQTNLDAYGRNIDLGLHRDRIKTRAEWAQLTPVSVGVEFAGENRTGTRPFGGNFGFGNALEIPEPIKYQTYDVSADVTYAGKPIFAQARVLRSQFRNSYESVLYDNPFRATDSTNSKAYSQNYQNGPRTGLSALPPDNDFDQASLLLAANLPLHGRISGYASHGWMTQDSKLLPVTTNSAITPSADPNFNTVDAQIARRSYGVKVMASPVSRAHLKAGYSYRQHDNNTPIKAIPDYVRTDAVAEGLSEPHYVSYIKRSVEVEPSYEVIQGTTLSVGYEAANNSFNHGSADKEEETIYRMTVDTRALPNTTVRVSGEMDSRDSEYPDYTAANAELPWMRKYYAASRDGRRVAAMIATAPHEMVEVTVEGTAALHDYTESDFGLLDDALTSGTVEVDVTPMERLSVGVFFTHEIVESTQRSRQWTPGGVGDPYTTATTVDDPSNWEGLFTENTSTVGLNASVSLIPDKLSAKLDGTASQSNGKMDFSSAVGGAIDANNWEPEDYGAIDDTRSASAGCSFRYRWTRTVASEIGYRYSMWDIKDYNYDGYSRVLTTASGNYNSMLTMDTLYQDFTAHSVYCSVSATF